ncbi:hypothetical protein V3C99_004349 [Haemonchus contortus]
MRAAVVVLLCLQHVLIKESTARRQGRAKSEFKACFNDEMLKPISPSYFNMSKVRHKTTERVPPVRVLGITPDCYVYYGWLQHLKNLDSKVDRIVNHGMKFGIECADFHPYIITTEGEKYQLLIGVRRAGRRMLVQSIARKYPLLSSENASVMWMQMNPRARHEQFLSNEFPPDFTFDYMNNLLHRIFILGRTSTGTRLLELKIHVDRNNNLFPFITSQILQMDPLLHAPFHGIAMVATHNLDILGTLSSGFILLRQKFEDGQPLPGKYIASAVPMESLLTESLQGIVMDASYYDGHIYRSKYITVYPNNRCKFIGNFMLFSYHVSSDREYTFANIPTPEQTLLKASTTRWFNHLNFHRRMAYPHTIHRSVKHGIFRAWIHCIPMILLNVLLLLFIFFGIEFAIYIHDKRKARRTGLSRSYSITSF